MRTIVEIPKKQLNHLADICSKRELSRAEAIRQAISLYIDSNSCQNMDEAFGIWKNASVDAVAYQKKLRAEWDK